MEHFIVSARKYRPTTFKSVVGQQAITNTLENAIANNHLAQALLFTGPRGVGKTTCARILAKKINQQGVDDPNEDFAFNIFELDAASNNSVDDIRSLTDQVRIPPQTGNYKVYIIDEVHMLSQAAFNAFLKTLEEPPKHAIFILATTEKHKIIPTILSRCQIFDFKRITVSDIKNHLAEIARSEGIQAEDDALHIIAQKADGALRDALSIFDRVVSFSGNNLTRQAVTENLNVLDYTTYFETTDFILNNDIPGALVLFDDILAKGFDGHHFISGLASHFRDLLVCKHSSTIALLEVGEQIKTKYFEQSQKSSNGFLLKAIEIANDCDLKYKTSKNQRLLVELCLMQLASITAPMINGIDQKKKSQPYIQPPQPKVKEPQTPVSEKVEVKTNPKPYPSLDNGSELQKTEEAKVAEAEEPIKPTPQTESKQKSVPERNAERISALSLKSIQQKRQLELQSKNKTKVTEDLPEEAFSETDLQTAWHDYAKILDHKGERIIASHLQMVLPVAENNVIKVTYPNQTIKVELERAQQQLLNFLSKKLNNYSLKLDIEVNESEQRNYVYTPKERFDRLKEKYPIMEKIKKTFDLDI
jgi:DNA polymerase III subunit gamma/tau